MQRRLHLSLVSIYYQGRRHWTICQQGKIDFLESVGRTWTRRWQNTGTFTASLSEAAIVAIKAFLSVIFASHWTDESSRCKVVALKEETGVIRGSPPQKAALLPAIMRAHYQAIIRYNICIYKAPFSKDACKAQNTIQKANQIKINTRKWKIGKTWYMNINMISIEFWRCPSFKHPRWYFEDYSIALVQTHRRPVSLSEAKKV